MVRHKEAKIIIMKEEFYTYRSLETGGKAHGGHTGKHQGWSRVRSGNEESMAQSHYWSFPVKKGESKVGLLNKFRMRES